MEASHVHERKPIDGMVMPATESMDAIRAFFGLATPGPTRRLEVMIRGNIVIKGYLNQ